MILIIFLPMWYMATTRSAAKGKPAVKLEKPKPKAAPKASRSKGSCAGRGRKNLKGSGAGRPGVRCPSQGYKK